MSALRLSCGCAWPWCARAMLAHVLSKVMPGRQGVTQQVLTGPACWQVLCLQGFLAARKHADRIILLAEMMQHSGCPCFKSGAPKALSALRKRFHMASTESQVGRLPCWARCEAMAAKSRCSPVA